MEAGGGYSTTAGKLPFPPASLSEGLTFLQACLWESSEVKGQSDLARVRDYLFQLYTSSKARLIVKNPFFNIFTINFRE